jgi:hypothetical protein
VFVTSAPAYAITETGRQRVDDLIAQKRLNLDAVKSVLDQAPAPGLRALQCVIAEFQKYPSQYTKAHAYKMPRTWMSA